MLPHRQRLILAHEHPHKKKGSVCQGRVTNVCPRLPIFVSTFCLLKNMVAEAIIVIEAPQNLLQLHAPTTAAAAAASNSNSSSTKEFAD